MSDITHKSKIEIIESLLKEEVRKNGNKIWGREVKLLNELIKKYPDEKFWRQLNLGFQLNSLAWFKADGQQELEIKWRYHKIVNQPKVDLKLDSATSNLIIA